METSFTRYPPFPQTQTFSASPPHLHRVKNLRHHDVVGRQPAMISPRLQRITTALNRPHRNPIQHSLATTTSLDLRSDLNSYISMADSDSKKDIKSGNDSSAVKETKETQKVLEIPPPPEKPLPGDCCGSGCVRCVWDVYYEELEEYNNKLCKGESGSAIGSKVS